MSTTPFLSKWSEIHGLLRQLTFNFVLRHFTGSTLPATPKRTQAKLHKRTLEHSRMYSVSQQETAGDVLKLSSHRTIFCSFRLYMKCLKIAAGYKTARNQAEMYPVDQHAPASEEHAIVIRQIINGLQWVTHNYGYCPEKPKRAQT